MLPKKLLNLSGYSERNLLESVNNYLHDDESIRISSGKTNENASISQATVVKINGNDYKQLSTSSNKSINILVTPIITEKSTNESEIGEIKEKTFNVTQLSNENLELSECNESDEFIPDNEESDIFNPIIADNSEDSGFEYEPPYIHYIHCNKESDIFSDIIAENDQESGNLGQNIIEHKEKSNLDSSVEEKTSNSPDTSAKSCNKGKTFCCTLCSKRFKRKYELNVHHRMHTGERPFECDICRKSFVSKSTHRVHMQTHSTVNGFKCSLCESRFFTMKHLKAHCIMHAMGVDKKHACQLCPKAFSAYNDLCKHMRVHTGERPYSCDICNARFKQVGSLNYHKRVHTGEKSFSCNVCTMKFAHKSTLMAHCKTHTGEKPFNCEICGKTFSRKEHLIRHVNGQYTHKSQNFDKPTKAVVLNEDAIAIVESGITEIGNEPI